MSEQFTVRWPDGRRVRLPLTTSSPVGTAAAVPRSRRRLTLHCPAGHFVGVITDTAPALVVRAHDRFPSFALGESGFLGVMTDDSGAGLLMLDGTPGIRVTCRTCDYLDCWLPFEDVAAAEDAGRKAISLPPRRADSCE